MSRCSSEPNNAEKVLASRRTAPASASNDPRMSSGSMATNTRTVGGRLSTNARAQPPAAASARRNRRQTRSARRDLEHVSRRACGRYARGKPCRNQLDQSLRRTATGSPLAATAACFARACEIHPPCVQRSSVDPVLARPCTNVSASRVHGRQALARFALVSDLSPRHRQPP